MKVFSPDMIQPQSLTLLQSKLTAPQYGRFSVPRSNLTRWMKSARMAKVVMIQAPAGFGKTTLMVQWLECHLQQKRCTAWLTLDKGDNDSGRFLGYIVQTIKQAISPEFMTAPSGVAAFSATLAGELLSLRDLLISIRSPFTLFLDDLGVVRTLETLEIVQQLIEWLPDEMQLVIASRWVPDINLKPLYARGEVVEISMEELRFSLEETERFVEKNQDSMLTKEDVVSLQRSTEGWVAGLQLSTLSQNWRELPVGQDVPIAGDFRKISEYLVEDVLVAQPDDVQQFLVHTSILKQFNAPLCDALLGRADSEAMLAYLEKANLFVIPLDKKGHWYRFHSLFARFLRNRLERGRREQKVRLHRAASAWYAAQGDLLEAISHALSADEPAEAACLMEHCAFDLVRSGQAATVADWGDGLPLPVLVQYPLFLLSYGYALLFRQQYEKAAEILDLLQCTVASSPHPQKLQDELMALMALLLLFQDRVDECETILTGDATGLIDEESVGRVVWLNIAGWLHSARGRFDKAQESLALSSQLRQPNDLVSAVYCRVISTTQELSQGHLRQAHSSLQELHVMIGGGPCRYTDAAAAVAAVLGNVLYEMDRLDEAEQILEPYLTLLPVWASPDVTIIGMCTLARIRFAQGDTPGAINYLTRLKHLAAGTGLSRAIASARIEEIRMAVQSGDLERGRNLAANLDDAKIWQRFAGWQLPANDLETPQISKLRLMIAAGDSSAALPLLKSELRKAVSAQRFRQAMLVSILLAKAEDSCGKRDVALKTLGAAVSAAQDEGFVRVFIDCGLSVAHLLRALRQRCLKEDSAQGGGLSLEFLDQLLTAMGDSLAPAVEFEDGDCPVLLEPLTEKERDLLTLLQDGLSNEILAEELMISVNTVRFHLRNINTKLDAANRTQAVAFARHLGLI